jgi:hypothetical protein
MAGTWHDQDLPRDISKSTIFWRLIVIIAMNLFYGGCMWKKKGLRTAAVESGAAESVAAAAWIRI